MGNRSCSHYIMAPKKSASGVRDDQDFAGFSFDRSM